MKKSKYLILGPLFFLYKLWIGLVFWITLLLLYPLFCIFLGSPKGYGKAFQLKRIWSKMLCALFFCPMRKTWRGKLPPAPYVIVSNHCSYLDTVFMYRLFSDYFVFMGKGELLHWPLFSKFFRTTDIAVDRKSMRGSFSAWQKAADAIDRGHCVAIYPEGTIPENTPTMLPFKNGAFKLAAEKKIPVVCVTWKNNFKIMDEPTRFFEFSLPQVIDVVIHESISGDDPTVLRDAARQLIQSELTNAIK